MLKADPVRRFLVTASVLMLLPTLALAWTAGTVVSRRVTNHVAQAGSAEVAANAAAVLRQSGLASTSTGDALVVFAEIANAVPAWQYFDTVVGRNPNTLAVHVYDPEGRVVFARDRSEVGARVEPDARFERALGGERETRVSGDDRPLGRLATEGAARSYSVLIPLAYPSGEAAGVLEVTQDLGPIASDMALARWMIVLIVVAVSAVLVGLTAYFATRLARRSFFDPVTALPNLSYLRSAARVVLDAGRRGARGGGLVLIDVDRFKLVNDTLGRAQGDKLLRDLAERLRAAVRGNDYVARLGGDDFAVLLPSADEASVRAAAERAVSAIATPFRAVGRDIRLEASAGVAMFPRDAVELDGLLQRAELALERAKRARRTVAFYRRESDAGRHSLYLESDLRTAIEREELDIVYQPICYLPTGEILGLEALTRWEHPTRGPIAPSTFIAMAERSGFIDRLDRWTLREATAQLAAWCRLGSNVIVTVNLAAQTLSDPGLPAYIEELLAETGAPPDLLALEVTERTALDDFETSAGVLMRLRETGVGVALDDFGRGYSSLATLDRLPISFLKLDASFTQGIGASLKDEHLLRAVKLFTKGIGIPFVAEGIETESQRTWLIRQGVRFGQGYLFSRPTARENIVPPRGVRANARLAPPMPAEHTRGQN
ncbi:MAG TPA: bifunctional diguanylate cyclase/phosphodiesterase [Trueperaceae bacterium]|nr:bifunctional diguanylate cyclase/phosphodiesterase [Trueperaceae bacterium]